MARKTIIVKGDGDIREYYCDAAITPGHLCERTATGMKVHATAGGPAAKVFAVEDTPKGGAIATAYTALNQGQFYSARQGDWVLGRIANGEAIAIGDMVESAGDGTLREVDTDSSAGTIVVGSIVGFAQEACDMSGSSAADPDGLCMIEVM